MIHGERNAIDKQSGILYTTSVIILVVYKVTVANCDDPEREKQHKFLPSAKLLKVEHRNARGEVIPRR